MNDKTVETVGKVIDKFSGSIDDLYQKLQQVAPEVWKLAVQRYVVRGALDLLYFLIWAFAGFALWRWAAKPLFVPVTGLDRDDNTGRRIVAWAFAVVAGVTIVLATSANLPDAIDHVINAKFYAAMCLVGRGCN